MSDLQSWTAEAIGALGLDVEIDEALLLDLARDVAHAVMRPAAPVTTYLLGLAVGAGADPVEATGVLQRLAAGWTPG